MESNNNKEANITTTEDDRIVIDLTDGDDNFDGENRMSERIANKKRKENHFTSNYCFYDVEVVQRSRITRSATTTTTTSNAVMVSPQLHYKKKSQHQRRFSCAVCLEDDIPSYQGYTIMECNHRFCLDCLIGLIKTSLPTSRTSVAVAATSATAIDTTNVASVAAVPTTTSTDVAAAAATTTTTISVSHPLTIVCPHDKCSNQLSYLDLQYILRNQPILWEQYTTIANLSTLEAEIIANKNQKDDNNNNNNNTRRCPGQHCNYIFVYIPGNGAEGRQFVCPSCNGIFCLQCGVTSNRTVGPGHVGLSCSDRREQLEKQHEERIKFQQWQIENSNADTKFQQLIHNEQKHGITQSCPKCNTIITKNGGCNHMHCTACKTNFNWGEQQRR